jgi:hypothetical protein
MSEGKNTGSDQASEAPAERLDRWMEHTGERVGRAAIRFGRRLRAITDQVREQAGRSVEAASRQAAARAGVPPNGDGRCPAGYPVKGNVREDSVRLYHVPGQRSYDQTKPERCFATEEDARKAGYQPAWPEV